MREFSKPIFAKFLLYFLGVIFIWAIYNYGTNQTQDITRMGVFALILALVILFLERKWFRNK
jgi:hypothetical protein